MKHLICTFFQDHIRVPLVVQVLFQVEQNMSIWRSLYGDSAPKDNIYDNVKENIGKPENNVGLVGWI